MKGLDLSKLQKVSEDDNYTTFRHHYGHEVKVAHKKLSSKMREDLSKIKMAKGGMVKKFADGGDTDDSSDQSSPPVVINVGGAQGQQPQPSVTPAPRPAPPPMQPQDQHGASGSWEDAPPSAMNTQNPVDNNQQQSIAPVPEPKKTPSQELDESLQGLDTGKDLPIDQNRMPTNSAGVAGNLANDPGYQKSYSDYFQDHKNEYAQQNAAFEQDLNNGHITPKTYQSMYGKQDTLGKVGMIFGMLASGAGSGLAHQPNAMMSMLDNTIKNDLDAQVQSKNNALSFLGAQRAQEMNQAQIGGIHAQTATAQYALAQAKELQTSFHYLTQKTMNMPEGPQKEAQKQMLGIMYNQMGQKINNLSDAAAGAEAFRKTMFGDQSAGAQNPDQNFSQRQGALSMMGDAGQGRSKFETERHFSGVPEAQGQMATRPIDEGDRKRIEAMQVLTNKGNDLLNFAKQNKGTLSPQKRAVGEQKAEEMMNYYNNSIQGGVLTQGRLQWLDKQINKNPTSVFQDILGNNARLQEVISSNEGRKGTLLKSYGITPKSTSGGGMDQNSAAEAWARANKSDPRAAKILKALGK